VGDKVFAVILLFNTIEKHSKSGGLIYSVLLHNFLRVNELKLDQRYHRFSLF
jgi:hypothetical protein